jgi:TonB-linked SusC/RagA family outer membrane protein
MKKLLLKGSMYCIACSITIPALPVASYGEYRYVTNNQQQTAAKKVLDEIASHYKVNFAYENRLLQNRFTTYKFSPITGLSTALEELLTPLGLKASRLDDKNYIIVAIRKNNTRQLELLSGRQEIPVQPAQQDTIPAQEWVVAADTIKGSKVIKGRIVTEEKEQPVSGASIFVRGMRIGTISDADGYFTIRIPARVRFISVGHVNYIAADVPVETRNALVIKARPKAGQLEQVIVTNGMFRRDKENFTGASNTISGDQLRQVNSVNLLEALKVFDPAIRIPDNVQFGSDPNTLPTITLRGTNNFPQTSTGTTSSVSSSGADYMATYQNNPNQPLFILDGFEVSLQKIYDLDINRVASFTILKDAAATAMYGSRAANGVIVVETKQPLPGKLRISYSGMMQIAAPDLTVYDLTNAAEKLEVERLAGIYSTYASGIRADADAVLRQTYADRLAAVQKGVNTYWLAQPVRTGFGQRHSFYIEGGDSYIRYGIDFGYSNNSGVMKNSNRHNYTGGMTLSYRRKGIMFKNNLSISANKGINSNYGSFEDYTKQNPYWSPYDSAGKLVKVLEVVRNPLSPGSGTSYMNPLYNTTLNTVDETGYTSILNQTNIDWQVANGLRLTGRLQINSQSDHSDVFLPGQHTIFEDEPSFIKKGYYLKINGKFFSYDGSLQLDFSRRVGGHQFMNTTGGSVAETRSEAFSIRVEGFPNDRLDQIAFGNGYPPNSKPVSSSSVTRRLSGYSNFNYSYDNRYVADVNFSIDGSSQFGSEKRFGSFWSVGASWNLHKEKFIADKPYINMFRIRGSYGTTGGDKFAPYQGITTYQYYTDQNYRGQLGTILFGFGNQNLQWQQTYKQNAGVDLSLLQNRISLNFDIYREVTKDLILDVTTPPSVGYGSYKDNLGEIENKGYEFRLNAVVFRNEKKQVYWTVYFNGLHNKDRILKISNSLSKLNETNDKNDQTRPKNRYEEGQSLNAIWAIQSKGIDPSNGREILVKRDGSLTYNWDALDKVIVGNTVPDLRGSFGTSFSWRGFNIGLYFSYEMGGQLYNQTLLDRVEVTNFNFNVDRRVLIGRWKKPGDQTYFKGLVDENGRTVSTSTNATSRFVQNNNFINGESISASYMFPEKFSKRFAMKNTRISFITNDIIRWSSIEVERGLAYPFARNFTINLSTSF